MISQTGNSSLNGVYQKQGVSKSTNANSSVSKQGDTSKIEQIKESILDGTYKVDLEALSKKIADELL